MSETLLEGKQGQSLLKEGAFPGVEGKVGQSWLPKPWVQGSQGSGKSKSENLDWGQAQLHTHPRTLSGESLNYLGPLPKSVNPAHFSAVRIWTAGSQEPEATHSNMGQGRSQRLALRGEREVRLGLEKGCGREERKDKVLGGEMGLIL